MESQEAKVLTMTLKSAVTNENGVTILELLIVGGLMVLITMFGINMVRKKTPYLLKSESRKLVGLIQHLYNQAIITNQTYRLAIDLENETRWVEHRSGATLLSQKLESSDSFSKATASHLRQKKLPRELGFKDVYLSYLNKKIDKGVAYIHFFPHGQAEAASIHLVDVQDVNYTLEIQSLSGKTEVQIGYH
jgi:general secretion pathway protein H